MSVHLPAVGVSLPTADNEQILLGLLNVSPSTAHEIVLFICQRLLHFIVLHYTGGVHSRTNFILHVFCSAYQSTYCVGFSE